MFTLYRSLNIVKDYTLGLLFLFGYRVQIYVFLSSLSFDLLFVCLLVLLCECVWYIYMYVQGHTCIQGHTCTHQSRRRCYWVLCLISLLFISLRENLRCYWVLCLITLLYFLERESLSDPGTKLETGKPQWPLNFVSLPSSWSYRSTHSHAWSFFFFFCGCWDLNSGPHSCIE